jgi:hypothetical protein
MTEFNHCRHVPTSRTCRDLTIEDSRSDEWYLAGAIVGLLLIVLAVVFA